MKLQTVKNKGVRGRILRILDIDYPRWMERGLMQQTLPETGEQVSPGELAAHLTYLEEKGYLEAEEKENDIFEVTMHMLRLTPKGKDLLEGTIAADPGVQLP